MMKEINGKITKKNNTFRKALKIIKNLLNSAKQVANKFNFFLTNLAPPLAENILPLSTDYTESLMSFKDDIIDYNLTAE